MGGSSVRGGAASGAAVVLFTVLAIAPRGSAVVAEERGDDPGGPAAVALPLPDAERSPMVRLSFAEVLRRTSALYDPEPRTRQRTFIHEPEEPVLDENADGKPSRIADGEPTRSAAPAPVTPSPLLTGPGLEDTSVSFWFQSAEDKLASIRPTARATSGRRTC